MRVRRRVAAFCWRTARASDRRCIFQSAEWFPRLLAEAHRSPQRLCKHGCAGVQSSCYFVRRPGALLSPKLKSNHGSTSAKALADGGKPRLPNFLSALAARQRLKVFTFFTSLFHPHPLTLTLTHTSTSTSTSSPSTALFVTKHARHSLQPIANRSQVAGNSEANGLRVWTPFSLRDDARTPSHGRLHWL